VQGGRLSSRASRGPSEAHPATAVVLLPLLVLLGCNTPEERVRVGYPEIPEALHPHRGGSEYAQSIGGNVYEALVARDADLSFGPGLARSWHSPDDRTWVAELEPDARFHDGTPLHAADVVRSLEAARSDPRSFYRDALEFVESVSAPSSGTVVLRTTRPVPILLNQLSQIAIVAERGEDAPPLGTGPYRIAGFEPARSVELRALPVHYRGKPEIDTLRFVAIPDAERRLEALASGEVDLIPSRGVPLPRFAALAARPGLALASRTGVRAYYLVMDSARTTNPDVDPGGENPFRNPSVRRALSLAIDRRELAASPEVGDELLDQLVVPEAFGHDVDLEPEPYDPERARRLLAQAGFGGGFDVTLDIAQDSDEVLPGLRRNLAAVGVRVHARLQSIAEVLARARRRDTAFLMLTWIGTAGDLGSTADYLLHSPTEVYGHYNGGGWSSPEADSLIESAGSTLHPGERLALLHRLAHLVREEAPVIPILRNRDRYAHRIGLRFRPRLDRRIYGTELSWGR